LISPGIALWPYWLDYGKISDWDGISEWLNYSYSERARWRTNGTYLMEYRGSRVLQAWDTWILRGAEGQRGRRLPWRRWWTWRLDLSTSLAMSVRQCRRSQPAW